MKGSTHWLTLERVFKNQIRLRKKNLLRIDGFVYINFVLMSDEKETFILRESRLER